MDRSSVRPLSPSAMRSLRRGAVPTVLMLLAGCSGATFMHDVGLSRDSPDEFAVTTRAPLSIPNDFSLPPPEPGAPRPQEPAAQLAAEAALTPSVELSNRTGADTPGQEAIVAAAGPPAPVDIRTRVDAEAARANSGGVVNTLAFWKGKQPPGKALDPAKEAARLRAAGIAGPLPTPAS